MTTSPAKRLILLYGFLTAPTYPFAAIAVLDILAVTSLVARRTPSARAHAF